MKKVIFTLSCIGLGLVSVSCSTDAYDLPDTNELKVQKTEEISELVLEDVIVTGENESDYELNNFDDETTGTNDNTNPVTIPPKKD